MCRISFFSVLIFFDHSITVLRVPSSIVKLLLIDYLPTISIKIIYNCKNKILLIAVTKNDNLYLICLNFKYLKLLIIICQSIKRFNE
jgi:hypothetical protein